MNARANDAAGFWALAEGAWENLGKDRREGSWGDAVLRVHSLGEYALKSYTMRAGIKIRDNHGLGNMARELGLPLGEGQLGWLDQVWQEACDVRYDPTVEWDASDSERVFGWVLPDLDAAAARLGEANPFSRLPG